MLFFDDGNDTAGRDRPSGTGSAAVCAAAVRRTGDHGVSPVVSDAHCIGRWHFLCTGGPRGTVLGGVPDPCGERNGSVTIRFGKIAKPYFLTTLPNPILHTYIPAILPKSFRPQAAWGTGASPSKRVCHTNAMLASTPPQAALVSQRCR